MRTQGAHGHLRTKECGLRRDQAAHTRSQTSSRQDWMTINAHGTLSWQPWKPIRGDSVAATSGDHELPQAVQ